MRKTKSRVLIKIPILHTKEDMGSLGHRLMVGHGYHAQTYDYWKKIQAGIKSLPYDFGKIKVYQDGLPDTKQELVERIVAEVQSPNYELLRWLRSQGATVIGTENPILIKEEYDLLKATFEAEDENQKLKARREYQEKADNLLSWRDAHIAKKIGKTLKKGELGILFLGAAHKIDSFLPIDIVVKYL